MASFQPELVLGVSTYAYELFTALDDLDAVYVPIGLGSGICGVIAMRDLLGLKTKVVGVSSERANGYARSFHAGTPVGTDTSASTSCSSSSGSGVSKTLADGRSVSTCCKMASSPHETSRM